jgi:hypothetical protein
MTVRRYPCRWCQKPIEGIDSYVMCPECVDDLAQQFTGTIRVRDDLARSPITPTVEASLRKLLDW